MQPSVGSVRQIAGKEEQCLQEKREQQTSNRQRALKMQQKQQLPLEQQQILQMQYEALKNRQAAFLQRGLFEFLNYQPLNYNTSVEQRAPVQMPNSNNLYQLHTMNGSTLPHQTQVAQGLISAKQYDQSKLPWTQPMTESNTQHTMTQENFYK